MSVGWLLAVGVETSETTPEVVILPILFADDSVKKSTPPPLEPGVMLVGPLEDVGTANSVKTGGAVAERARRPILFPLNSANQRFLSGLGPNVRPSGMLLIVGTVNS